MSRLKLDEGDTQLVQSSEPFSTSCTLTFRRGYIHIEIKKPTGNALGFVNVTKKQRAALRKALTR